ncbi:hypothetical protein [Pseudoclavibacter sp. RFBA6]|uniref:hypothetical protein n=1 Tax=Pseudoclavibacter sp. RFBA6 TaxID=2080573 RepID=UPI0021584605|nr:hypothetical protein [Pseudoclavibacter sp. RFBA6]
MMSSTGRTMAHGAVEARPDAERDADEERDEHRDEYDRQALHRRHPQLRDVDEAEREHGVDDHADAAREQPRDDREDDDEHERVRGDEHDVHEPDDQRDEVGREVQQPADVVEQEVDQGLEALSDVRVHAALLFGLRAANACVGVTLP